MLSVIFCIHFLSHAVPVFGQNYVPVITNYTALNNRYLSESLPKDTYIGKISAYDPDGTSVNYFIEGNGGEYFAIDRYTGDVTLKKLMDFETEIEIKLNIKVIDGNNQMIVVEGKVFVNDANDNPPYFNDTAIFRSLPEDAPVGFLVAPILVRDRDTSNSAISLSCIRVTPLLNDSCNTFGLTLIKNSNEYWNGSLVLIKSLDYETRISYAIRLLAFDGVFNVTNEIHIEVIDINDTPPRWINAEPIVIDEELPVGTYIQTVSAQDGDITNKHEIYYELIGNNTDTFGINSSSGGIYVKKRIDFDDQNYPKNVPYDVTILAREIITKNATYLQLGNDGSTTATVTIKITARDINDNSPTFDMRTYDNIFIDENIIAGANVPGLQMTVTDIDSGTFNSFNLITLNYTTIFGIIPEQDSGSSSATLFVKNSDTIDYESGVRKYVIEVQAIENMVSPAHTGSATVTITVRDVNDVTPNFNEKNYTASVSETAPAGTSVIQVKAFDPEEGIFGTAGIRYKLYGNIPAHFTINPLTGDVQVAPCSGTPGVGPQCIDYEKKKVYSLVVSATDALEDPKIGLTRSVQLTIYIIDENDVVPGLESSYVRYMYEGETVTINPLIVNATDPDTVGGPVSYYISGDSTNLWQAPTLTDSMGHNYTNITATRTISYTDAPDTLNGAFHFSIVAQDKKYTQSSLVNIFVIDINNNAPVFSPATYIQSIYENTKGDFFVMKVTASDADSYTTGNGQIDFYIQSGAVGKFTVTNVTRNSATGVYTADVYTTSDATFNYDIQNHYEMQLYARDSGTPASKFGTATLIVNILDINNRDPRINPLSQSVTVSENEKVGNSVYRILAEDPDANSILKFYFTPDKAIDGTGNAATSTVYDYRTMFRIDANTGNIFVNSSLDRQSVSRITYSVRVEDVAANPVQNGTGSFLVYILEYNDQAPRFDFPVYNISLEEEQNINSFVVNLNCRDDDDKIAGYDLIQTSPLRPVYFSLIPGSGAMIVNDRIDFEQIEKIELTARCTDSGQPQLSNTTSVIVNVLNINDNIPFFQQQVYRKNILEGTYSGPLNLTVSASDGDKGDFSKVRYYIQDPSVTFTINNTTGDIYFVPNSTFDREKNAYLSFQVLAVDSPLNPALNKSSFVTVYVTIDDVNDHCPEFDKSYYEGKVPESAGPGTNIIDLIVTDADSGPNAEFSLNIKSGSFNPASAFTLFAVNPNGRIIVANSLRAKAGRYNFTVTATDHSLTNPCTTEVPVTIEIQVSLNDAPVWIKPPNRDFVIYVLESQYDGMLVYGAKAVDNNAGANGIVDYYFVINKNELVANTSEFRINHITGVIRAEIVYDREQTDRYFLTLMAKDRGSPSASSETTLTVIILDVDDNRPVFAMKNGVVTPLILPDTSNEISENVIIPTGGLKLGACNATDADSDTANNRIFYKILSDQPSITDYIRVNNITCDIFLIKKPDFETTQELLFDIYAYNDNNNDRVIRNKREVDPSILPVIIRIKDSNDNAPKFSQVPYYECVAEDAPYRQNILEISATDSDTGSIISYNISKTDAFVIDSNLGIISNIISFQYTPNAFPSYTFEVTATDGVYINTTNVTIYVVSTSNLVYMKINRPLYAVEPFKQLIAKSIQESDNRIMFACIIDMKSHVEDDGTLNSQATDISVAAVSASTRQLYTSPDLVSLIEKERTEKNSVYNAVLVTNVKEYQKKDEFSLSEDAVLAILIITILLIFLAIVLFIIACLCIRRSKKKKTKAYQSKSTVLVPQPLEPSSNPVFRAPHTEEDVYTLPKKKPMHSEQFGLELESPALTEPVNIPPPEPFRGYLNTEPEPVIETELESLNEYIPEPPTQPFEPEFEDKIVTIVDDDELPAPFLEGEIETEIRNSPTTSSISSPASSRKSGSHHSD